MIMMIRLVLVFAFLISLAHADELLDPAVAFKPSLVVRDAQTIEIRYDIAKGYYLYRDKFRFAVSGDAATLGKPIFPQGQLKDDENFGKVEVYFRRVNIQVPVGRTASGQQPLELRVTAQGCAEGRVCYPPQTQTLAVELPDMMRTAAPAGEDRDESGSIATRLQKAGFWVNLAFFFVAGLGLALTPCVFPMIPILSSIVVGQGRQVSHARGFALALVYVMGMALTYTAFGIAAGLTGTLLSNGLQNVWVLGSFALVFLVLSLSMFGLYELQLPSALQSKLSEESGHLRGGRGVGVFLLGALSALIVGPCVAAPLAGALLYIGKTGDAVLGGSALFAMALGMGIPLIAVGSAGGSLLPKTGPWMEGIKKAFGVVLLATAVWIVSPVVPPVVSMLAWAALLIFPAIFLRALDPLPPHANSWSRLWKGVGVVMLLAGAALLMGALAGNRNPIQPLVADTPNATPATAPKLPFVRVHSLAELEQHLTAAKQPVMLDFYADWCISCKEMERFTFSDSAVQAQLSGFLLLKADVTANSADDKALLARFGLFGPPGIVFFDRNGQEKKGIRVVGFQEASRFVETLKGLD